MSEQETDAVKRALQMHGLGWYTLGVVSGFAISELLTVLA